MEKLFDINNSGFSVRCKLYCSSVSAVTKAVIFGHGFGGNKDNKAAAEKLEKENAISAKLSNKWYYNICPNCGAYPSQVLKHCDHCGASLEVDSFENGTQSSVHKISLKE